MAVIRESGKSYATLDSEQLNPVFEKLADTINQYGWEIEEVALAFNILIENVCISGSIDRDLFWNLLNEGRTLQLVEVS